MSDIPRIRQDVESLELSIAPLAGELAQELLKPNSEMNVERINRIRTLVGGSYARIQQSLGQYNRLPRVPQIDPESLATGAQAVRFHDTTRFFEDARHRSTMWRRLANLIEKQLDSPSTPLLDLSQPDEAIQLQHLTTLNEMYLAFHRLANPLRQDSEAIEKSCFADIALPATEFVAYAHAAYRICLAQRRTRPVKFLDVGCGGGTKVVMAASFFGRTDGLEYDAGYVRSGQTTLEHTGPENSRIFRGNALTFENYADYDVIYFYRPIANEDERMRMEDLISNSARPGTVLIAPFNGFGEGRETLNCSQISVPLYVTGVDQAAAKVLLADAEATGVGVPAREYSLEPRTGYLAPLVQACIENGYVL